MLKAIVHLNTSTRSWWLHRMFPSRTLAFLFPAHQWVATIVSQKTSHNSVHLQAITIGTFGISLRNFTFGLLICEIISRLISQGNCWRMILWYFQRSFHNFRCDPVGACGGVAVFIQESAKHVKSLHNWLFTTHFLYSQRNVVGIILWKVLCRFHNRKMFGESIVKSKVSPWYIWIMSCNALHVMPYTTDMVSN